MHHVPNWITLVSAVLLVGVEAAVPLRGRSEAASCGGFRNGATFSLTRDTYRISCDTDYSPGTLRDFTCFDEEKLTLRQCIGRCSQHTREECAAAVISGERCCLKLPPVEPEPVPAVHSGRRITQAEARQYPRVSPEVAVCTETDRSPRVYVVPANRQTASGRTVKAEQHFLVECNTDYDPDEADRFMFPTATLESCLDECAVWPRQCPVAIRNGETCFIKATAKRRVPRLPVNSGLRAYGRGGTTTTTTALTVQMAFRVEPSEGQPRAYGRERSFDGAGSDASWI